MEITSTFLWEKESPLEIKSRPDGGLTDQLFQRLKDAIAQHDIPIQPVPKPVEPITVDYTFAELIGVYNQ